MSEDFTVPEEALSERFLAATGPGGQNVNKVATACQLRVDVFKLGLSPYAYERLKGIAGSRMTTAGELVITARRVDADLVGASGQRRELDQSLPILFRQLPPSRLRMLARLVGHHPPACSRR